MEGNKKIGSRLTGKFSEFLVTQMIHSTGIYCLFLFIPDEFSHFHLQLSGAKYYP